jgi:thiol-disulfide isomerase/thioredoxin
MLFHPTDLRLGLFADGELRPPAVRRVARHLQRCGRCRARVTATRKLSRDARDLKIPPLPPGLRQRVLRGLAVGEPVIVPVADPPVPVWPWRRLGWVAIGSLVIIGGVRLVVGNRLYSEASVLEFTPARPSAGEEITVTYHATGQLGLEAALRLRAQYRESGDRGERDVRPITTTPLRRRSDRTYEARVRLPAGVVYAAFAVEDEAGAVVDHGGTMGWELLVHAGGRPSYDALRQRVEVAVGRDPGEALEAAIEATRLDPGRVEIWSMRSTLEAQAYGPDAYDSLRAVHVPRVRAFDQQLGQTPVSADVLGVMYLNATTWRVLDVAERWRERALREAPRSPIAAQLKTIDILREPGEHPHERLRLLDSLYDAVGTAPAVLSNGAFALAYAIKDPDASLRWARRVIAVEPGERVTKARQLLSFPSLSDTVLAWVDGEIARLGAPDDGRRPLSWSKPRYLRDAGNARLDLLGLKGQILLRRGDTPAALAYLDSAVAEGWDIARFRAAAAARLAAADTLGAAQLLARIAVDPAVPDEDADRYGRRLVGASVWAAERDRALSDMLRETRREAQPHVLFDPVRLTRRAGDTVDVRATLQGHVTVVAFWHPWCRTCLAEVQELHSLVADLPNAPRLAIVSRRPLGPADWAMLDDAGLAPVVMVDGEGQAMQAFRVWATGGLFVVDPRGVIQYHDVSLNEVPRCIMTLVPMQDVVMDRGRTDARAVTAE